MAEIIEFRNEETIPEVESMLSLIFEKHEIQTIVNRRKEFEYKIHRKTKRKEDMIKYINYETDLMRVCKLRHKKKGLQKNAKMSNLEFNFSKRINQLFMLSLRWFPNDLRIWLAYIRFCKQRRFFSAASRVLEQMLVQFGSAKPELYKIAAELELNECNCIEKARKYLLMGIHEHKTSKLLLTEAFKLELIDAERKRKQCIEKNIAIDPTNVHLTYKKAEAIYDISIKNLKDIELMNDILNICTQYDFAAKLCSRITHELFSYDTNERMWDIIALRELKLDDSTPKAKIGKCVKLYETAVKRLPTNKMWSYYLDAMIDLNKDKSVLPNFKRKLLATALQRAAAAGKLSEKYYIYWVSLLQEPEKHKKLVEVLQCAVKKLPQSVNLWHCLLRVHVFKGEEKQAYQVFEQAIATIPKQSLPLWKLMLQFEQTKRGKNKVEELFKKSWTQCPEISGPLRPMYLEWLVLTQGIVAARKTYDYMCELPASCLEMHKKMIYLETIQPTMNLRRIRQTYTIACAQFGDSNADIWIDYCKFECNHGEPSRMSDIFWRARENFVSSEVQEVFFSEFSLLQNISSSVVST